MGEAGIVPSRDESIDAFAALLAEQGQVEMEITRVSYGTDEWRARARAGARRAGLRVRTRVTRWTVVAEVVPRLRVVR